MLDEIGFWRTEGEGLPSKLLSARGFGVLGEFLAFLKLIASGGQSWVSGRLHPRGVRSACEIKTGLFWEIVQKSK